MFLYNIYFLPLKSVLLKCKVKSLFYCFLRADYFSQDKKCTKNYNMLWKLKRNSQKIMMKLKFLIKKEKQNKKWC